LKGHDFGLRDELESYSSKKLGEAISSDSGTLVKNRSVKNRGVEEDNNVAGW
jgi:hypothetical protein